MHSWTTSTRLAISPRALNQSTVGDSYHASSFWSKYYSFWKPRTGLCVSGWGCDFISLTIHPSSCRVCKVLLTLFLVFSHYKPVGIDKECHPLFLWKETTLPAILVNTRGDVDRPMVVPGIDNLSPRTWRLENVTVPCGLVCTEGKHLRSPSTCPSWEVEF